MTTETFDVLVIGAGICGLSAAWQVPRRCADRRIAVREARHTLGGTWSLFRYMANGTSSAGESPWRVGPGLFIRAPMRVLLFPASWPLHAHRS